LRAACRPERDLPRLAGALWQTLTTPFCALFVASLLLVFAFLALMSPTQE